MESLYKVICPKCYTDNLINNGDETDCAGVDVTACTCWSCKYSWFIVEFIAEDEAPCDYAKEGDPCVNADELRAMQKTIDRLRFALTGAFVDYDHAPGQLLDPEFERLRMFNVQDTDSEKWIGTHYQLDEQAIDVLAKSSNPWWATVDTDEYTALIKVAKAAAPAAELLANCYDVIHQHCEPESDAAKALSSALAELKAIEEDNER